MKNSLTSPKFPAIFKRYAPLLQGGLMKISMLFGIILLCGFTMFRFLHTQLQGMTEVFGAENVRTISMVVGTLIGAGTITHFAGLLPLLIRDFIQLWKEQKDKGEKRVHTGVLIINSLIVVAILCFDGYVSTTGIKNAVADMGEDIADSRFNAEKSTYEGNFSAAEGKVIQAWRTDSSNIESLYGGKIKGLKEKSSGEIGALRGKASRGEAAGSTSWAASLRSIASNKNSQMETKIAEFEAQKAEDLLLRAQQRDKDLSAKEGDKSSGIVAAKGKGDKMENRFKRYGGMTWVLSLGLYLIYIGTCIKHELIHFGAGIENEVEVAERYFRPGFMQNLVHELGNWAHDLGRLITNFLAKKRLAWSEKLREKAYLPLDAGDVYRQEVDFSAAIATNHRAEQMAERGQSVEEPYKQTGKIGFGASYLSETRTQPQTPQLPPKPPILTEVIAPCENEFLILSSDLRAGKTEMVQFVGIPKSKIGIPSEEVGIPMGTLTFTQIGINTKSAKMKCMQKKGEVRPATYAKNMERIAQAKAIIKQQSGQLELWV